MADLKTIIQITQEQLKRQVPLHEAVLHSLEALPAREADVLSRRTGLRAAKPETLATIGDRLGVTRERVRQIEHQGRTKFATQIKQEPLAGILKLALEFIREQGGVMDAAAFAERFLPESQRTDTTRNALKLLLLESKAVVEVHEDKAHGKLYALSNAHAAAATGLIGTLAQTLTDAKAPLPLETLATAADEATVEHDHLVSEKMVASVLDFGTGFIETDDGRYGLSTWRDINPKNIHDKTLYVLRKLGTPMHFEQITEEIKKARFDKKPVTVQAVHNELSNGTEFVLIGRGIYALREWGYVSGTVADVIRTILRKAGGPLERDQIVKEVLKQRRVSENTILINLQEKARFRRVGEQYTVAPETAHGTDAPTDEPAEA
ncbi:MAG: sigma factor-like helix-turn-helix DNA-binding protein [Patescibacteria group bacterium]